MAWNMALHSIKLRKRDRVIHASDDYAGNYVASKIACDRSGAKLVILPSNDVSGIDLEQLARELSAGRRGSTTVL